MRPEQPLASGCALAAIVLAAGQGARLGGLPKAALRFGGASLLERLAQALRGAGIVDVGAVIGPYTQVLLPLARRSGVQAIRHPRDGASLVDSQRLAIAWHAAAWPERDLLLLPCDLPLLTREAIAALLAQWRRRPSAVQALRPMVGVVPGHPIILSASAAAFIAGLPVGMGIRDWLRAHPARVQAWPGEDPAYVTDLDTPDDLQRLGAAMPGRDSGNKKAA